MGSKLYKGVDAELGVWVLHKTPCNWFGLYLAGGPYYFTRDHRRHTVDDDHRDIKGAQGRILAKINDYVELSVLGTYDNFYHGTVQWADHVDVSFDFFCGNKSSDCAATPCLACGARSPPSRLIGTALLSPTQTLNAQRAGIGRGMLLWM